MTPLPFVVFFFSAILLVLFVFVSKKIERNCLLGFRNKYTLQSEYVWREINPKSSRCLGGLGVIVIALSLMGFLSPSYLMLYLVIALMSVGPISIVFYYHLLSKRLFFSEERKREESDTGVLELESTISPSLKIEIIPVIIIIVTLFTTYLMYDRIPDRIPTHYDFMGRPDHWEDKSWFRSSILLIVQISSYALISIFTALGKKVSSGTMSGNSDRVIFVLKTFFILVFGLMQYFQISGLNLKMPWLVSIMPGVIIIGVFFLIFVFRERKEGEK